MKIDILPEASSEVRSAYAWYEAIRHGLGDQLLTALDAVLERVRRFPESYPAWEGSSRRALLRRFPYCVVYELSDHRAVIHTFVRAERNPASWPDRTREVPQLVYGEIRARPRGRPRRDQIGNPVCRPAVHPSWSPTRSATATGELPSPIAIPTHRRPHGSRRSSGRSRRPSGSGT